ncbi:MAG: Spy/CpxP family protein refolding chaperone [Pyrinomonadaceae bacterium]
MLKIFSPDKRLAATLLAMALCLLAHGANVEAQEQAEPPAQQQRPGGRVRGLNLMQRLNLSREQRQRLREIRQQSEPETRELARRVRLARRALDEAIYADATDEALIGRRSRELSQAQSALTDLRASTELQVRRVLTDEQLRLFRNLRRQAQRRQMLQRRMNRALRQSAAPPADEPDADAPDDTQPGPTPPNPPAPRRRRP